MITEKRILRHSGFAAWSTAEIINALTCVDMATTDVLTNVPDGAAVQAYRAGYINAMRAVCAALGLEYRPG